MGSSRVSTGIEGFDRLVEGGFPRGDTILLIGNPGTGKTGFSAQFLYKGLVEGECGIYVSFSEGREAFF
ncbi:KaiC domain-containing protein, partial [Candidatus Bathyarchaeota archaeon]